MSSSAITKPSAIIQLGTFLLDGQLFGVDILHMREIIRPLDIVKVPCASSGVEGVINLRGEVIPIISLRAKLGMPIRPFDRETRIINMDVDGMVAGFLVDAIGHVKQVRADAVENPPNVDTTGEEKYLSGVIQDGETLIMMLSLERLIDVNILKDLCP